MTRKLLTWIVVLSTLGMLSLSAIAEDAQSPKPEVQSLAAGRENGARPKTWKALAELSAEEKVSLDLQDDSPRDSLYVTGLANGAARPTCSGARDCTDRGGAGPRI